MAEQETSNTQKALIFKDIATCGKLFLALGNCGKRALHICCLLLNRLRFGNKASLKSKLCCHCQLECKHSVEGLEKTDTWVLCIMNNGFKSGDFSCLLMVCGVPFPRFCSSECLHTYETEVLKVTFTALYC